MKQFGYMVFIDKILLPVTPSSIDIKNKNRNKTVELIDNSEFTFLKEKGLKEISFKFMLPSQHYPFARYLPTFKRPSYFIEKLDKLKSQGKSFQLIIIRTYPNGIRALYNTNIKVSLEDYNLSETADDGLDTTVDIVFKEFIDPRPEKITVNADGTANKTNQRWTDKVQERITSTKAGKYIWEIVREETGGLDQLEAVMRTNTIASVGAEIPKYIRWW